MFSLGVQQINKSILYNGRVNTSLGFHKEEAILCVINTAKNYLLKVSFNVLCISPSRFVLWQEDHNSDTTPYGSCQLTAGAERS